MRIIKAKLEAVPVIAELEKLCFSEPWSAKSIEDSLRASCNSMFIASEGELAMGYIGLTVAADEGYILNVAVRPECRRKGVGRALVEYVISEFSSQLSFLTLEVRPSNNAAIALYTGLGFEKAGERRDYYTNPVENALLLTKFFEKGKNI